MSIEKSSREKNYLEEKPKILLKKEQEKNNSNSRELVPIENFRYYDAKRFIKDPVHFIDESKKLIENKTKLAIDKKKEDVKGRIRKSQEKKKEKKRKKSIKRKDIEQKKYKFNNQTQLEVKNIPTDYEDDYIKNIYQRILVLFDEYSSIIHREVISRKNEKYNHVQLRSLPGTKIHYYNTKFRVSIAVQYKKSKLTKTKIETDNIQNLFVYILDDDNEYTTIINDLIWGFDKNQFEDNNKVKETFTKLIMFSLDDVEEYFKSRGYDPHERYISKQRNKSIKAFEIAEKKVES